MGMAATRPCPIQWDRVLLNRTSLRAAAGAVHAVADAPRAHGTPAATTTVRGGQRLAEQSALGLLAGLSYWCSYSVPFARLNATVCESASRSEAALRLPPDALGRSSRPLWWIQQRAAAVGRSCDGDKSCPANRTGRVRQTARRGAEGRVKVGVIPSNHVRHYVRIPPTREMDGECAG